MCHHHEAREWAARREALEEAEADDGEDEEIVVEPATEADHRPETEDRLPPIQPSD